MPRPKVIAAAIAAIGLLFVAVGLLVSPATAGANFGTLKVTEDSQCSGPDNDPKVGEEYFLAGFGFPTSESFTIKIRTQPGGVLVQELSGSTDAEGNFCLGPITTPLGMYKATFTDSAGVKHKVYRVLSGTPSTSPPPTTNPPPPPPPPPTTTAPPTTEPPTTGPPTTGTPVPTVTVTTGTDGGGGDVTVGGSSGTAVDSSGNAVVAGSQSGVEGSSSSSDVTSGTLPQTGAVSVGLIWAGLALILAGLCAAASSMWLAKTAD